MFHFKQFSVDQSGCAMKINTDGVLLGALCKADNPAAILDVGTGTGVIALMMAQRFDGAIIDAVEIDGTAAQTAKSNFENSPFAKRLSVFSSGFEAYFDQHPEKKYDLIVSNPPFHINSLKSANTKTEQAKHTDRLFFERLIKGVANRLTNTGSCWLVLPLETSSMVKQLAGQQGIYVQNLITLHSFNDDVPHREIVALGLANKNIPSEKFVIYDARKVYSKMYAEALKNFFLIF